MGSKTCRWGVHGDVLVAGDRRIPLGDSETGVALAVAYNARVAEVEQLERELAGYKTSNEELLRKLTESRAAERKWYEEVRRLEEKQGSGPSPDDWARRVYEGNGREERLEGQLALSRSTIEDTRRLMRSFEAALQRNDGKIVEHEAWLKRLEQRLEKLDMDMLTTSMARSTPPTTKQQRVEERLTELETRMIVLFGEPLKPGPFGQAFALQSVTEMLWKDRIRILESQKAVAEAALQEAREEIERLRALYVEGKQGR